MTTRTHQPHTVQVKAKWADAWTTIAGLYCDWFKFSVSPDVAEAMLSRTFGRVMYAGTSAHVPSEPQNLTGYYVKVEVAQNVGMEAAPAASPVIWYGVIVDTQHDRQGQLTTGEVVGKQAFICRGLEYLLQRTTVDSSFVRTPTGEQEIGRAIAFNLGGGNEHSHFRQANRSPKVGSEGTFLFAQTLTEGTGDSEAQWWTGDLILYHLLMFHSPRDKDGIEKINFTFDMTATVLTAFKPTLQTQGKTVKQCLDELIDRRRGLCWSVEVASGSPKVKVYSFNKDILTLPSGATIPANPNQTTWLLDSNQLVERQILAIDGTSTWDCVVARGERLGGCFTVSYASDNSLEADWTSALQTAYNAGASGAAGYGALDDYAKMDANQQYRRSDKFLKVYRYFRVPPTWDGTLTGVQTCPDPTTDPDFPVQTKFWWPGVRFESYLPLLVNTNYATVESITFEELTGSKREYLRPFALIYDSTASRYYPLEKMSHGGALADDLPESAGREYSAHLRMQDESGCLGIILDCSGYPQHVIASLDFTPADTADGQDYQPDLPWQAIYATVFCEFDQHLEARWPDTPLTTTADVVMELIIDVPNARLDYLAPGTLIGIDEGGAAIATAGGYVRDDRVILKDIARSAFQWYGTTRKSLSVTMASLISTVALGNLITFVGNDGNLITVNTIVTQQVYDLLAGTVTTTTNFAELDFTARQ